MAVRFKATNEQLRHLQATATNASTPRGMAEYPTARALVEAAGLTAIEEAQPAAQET